MVIREKDLVNLKDYQDSFANAREVIDDCNRNLARDSRRLEILTEKMQRGDFSLDTKSTLQKRAVSPDFSQEGSSNAQKRLP